MKGGVVTVSLAGKGKKAEKIPAVGASGEFTFSYEAVGKKQ